ncbi:MAG: hypothetical protein ABSB83_07075 [Methanomassiliicoccales archaeon]|jgi:membrane protein YdbS with pleckstrin-like domain
MKSFAYSKKSLSLDFLIFAIAAVIVLTLLSITAKLDIPSMTVGATIVVITLVVLGASPLFTAHEIMGDRLILRQGWYFKAEIPLRNIKKIEMVERGPLRTGVFFRLLQPTLFVTSKRYDLVALELKEKQRFGWALGKKANKILFDVLEPDRFLRTVEELRRSLSPIQS